MPKPIGDIQGLLETKRGTEPTNIVSVQWGAGNAFIDYHENESNAPNADGRILSLTGIDSVRKITGGGGVGAVTILLDDSDGELEALLKDNNVHKSKVKIYQTFENESGRALIFSGEVSSPIVYSEDVRTLSFEALTVIESEEVGFSPEESDGFDFIDESAFGKAWPLCFGDPIRVPAVKITGDVRGTSLTRYAAITLGDLNDLCNRSGTFADAESDKLLQEANFTFDSNVDEERIRAFGGAKTALDTLLSSLIFDAPTQEQNLIDYSEACIKIRKNERNFSLFTGVFNEAEAQIALLQPQVDSLNLQIDAALNAGDAALVESLTAQRDLLLNGVEADAEAGTQEIKGLNQYKVDKQTAELAILVAEANIAIFEKEKDSLEKKLLVVTLTVLKVQGGEKFPQGEEVKLIINGAKFAGTFDGEEFTISEPNLPVNTSISTTPGVGNQFEIGDATLTLKGQYAFLNDAIIFIEDQDGTTCTYSPTLFKKTGEFTFGGDGRDLYAIRSVLGTISQTSALFFATWRDTLRAQVNGVTRASTSDASSAEIGSSAFSFANGLDEVRASDYAIEIGDTVFLEDDYEETYIANLIPSNEVLEVMAFRLLNGVRRIVPIPSRYYTVNLAEEIAGQTSTTLRFQTPLTQYKGEDWEEEVYVTLVSSERRNVSDTIKYLLENYTSLAADSASFAAVAGEVAFMPADFALLERRDALSVIDDIAYQARCATFLRNEEMVLVNLAKEPATIRTLDESNTALDSVQISFTPTEDIVTKMTAVWRRDYAKEHEDRGKLNKIVLRNNIPLYGNHEEEREFFIYNIKELVERSLTFWLIRKSNTWYQISLQGYLDQLELESYDGVEFAFNDSDHPLLFDLDFVSQVLDIEYNSETKEIDFVIWRPVQAGEDEEHPLAYPSTDGEDYPTSFDQFTGGEATL